MSKRLFLGVVIGACFLTSCGPVSVGGVVDSSAPSSEPTVSESTPDISITTETTGETPTTTDTPDATSPASDRMVAPDFTLALGTGGTFTLSESEKPVYLVFWAEW